MFKNPLIEVYIIKTDGEDPLDDEGQIRLAELMVLFIEYDSLCERIRESSERLSASMSNALSHLTQVENPE